jgi:MscS family membrane protein
MQLALWLPVMALASADYPLEPLDLSSPRATLRSFLNTGDAFFRLLRDEYWDSSNRAVAERMNELGAKAESTLDLSKLPPAARYLMGKDGAIYLYEVLSRIKLPPEADIPDAAAYADTGTDKADKIKPASWTIPHTEITLERMTDGPRASRISIKRRKRCPTAAMFP